MKSVRHSSVDPLKSRPHFRDLQALQRTERYLITFVAEQLPTPLSTLQVGLECLDSEVDRPSFPHREIFDSSVQDTQHLSQLIHHGLNASVDFSDSLDLPQEPPPPLLSLSSFCLTDPSFSHTRKTLQHQQDNLVAIFCHEFLTPLSTIQLSLDSLIHFPEMTPPSRHTLLTQALTALHRLRHLTHTFHTFSRLTQGCLSCHLESVSLSEILAISLSHPSAAFSPSILMPLPSNLPLLLTDGDRLRQVFQLLLDNARQFTPSQGEIRIQAHLFSSQSQVSSPLLEVIVADTGCGIASHHLESIFLPLYQAEKALRRTTNGMGMGLALARLLLAPLGGRIWATSSGLHQGSQFHLTLPIVPSSMERC